MACLITLDITEFQESTLHLKLLGDIAVLASTHLIKLNLTSLICIPYTAIEPALLFGSVPERLLRISDISLFAARLLHAKEER
jgi:hypothetical protein